MASKAGGIRLSEQQLADIQKKKKVVDGRKGSAWDEPDPKKPKTRSRAKDEKPVLKSIKECIPSVHFGDGFVTFIFPDIKLFTLNDIYQIKEFRAYVDYQYKEAWHKLIDRAVLISGGKKNFPDFSSGCEISVFRKDGKKVDRDALSIMFKYAIDGFRYSGILPDDNSDIVRNVRPFQAVGEPLAIIRIDRTSEPETEIDEKTLIESSTSVWLAKKT